MTNLYDKQNDKNSLRYLWASEYCYRQKRSIIFFEIIVSVVLSVMSIINKYLPIVFPDIEDVVTLSTMLSQIIVLVSGCVIVMETVLNFVAERMNIESVNLIEKYDIFIFNLFPNKAIMRPISDQNMLVYASRFKKKQAMLNYYFKSAAEAEDKYAHFNAVKKRFEYDYYLMLDAKSFLYSIWIGFVIVLLIFAFAVNSTWTDSIVYIFIPSLSAIGMIATSWHNYNLKIKFLENILFVISEYSKKIDDPSNAEGTSSRIVMRSLQDAMFTHRINDFILPDFILKRYDKKKIREAKKTILRETPTQQYVTTLRKNKQVIANADIQAVVKSKKTDNQTVAVEKIHTEHSVKNLFNKAEKAVITEVVATVYNKNTAKNVISIAEKPVKAKAKEIAVVNVTSDNNVINTKKENSSTVTMQAKTYNSKTDSIKAVENVVLKNKTSAPVDTSLKKSEIIAEQNNGNKNKAEIKETKTAVTKARDIVIAEVAQAPKNNVVKKNDKEQNVSVNKNKQATITPIATSVKPDNISTTVAVQTKKNATAKKVEAIKEQPGDVTKITVAKSKSAAEQKSSDSPSAVTIQTKKVTKKPAEVTAEIESAPQTAKTDKTKISKNI